MKWISPILITLFFSSCVMLGTNMIHSPSANNGTPYKPINIHGGPTKNAPPSITRIQINDTSNVLIEARTIYQKKNFTGVIIPILPTFWLPKINHYEEQPNSTIIKLSTWPDETDFEVSSATIRSNGQSYELIETVRTNTATELRFQLSAEQTSEFELTNLALTMHGIVVNIPSTNFKKMKQRWRFVGP